LIIGVKRIIKINHISDRDITKTKIDILVSNVFNKTMEEFNCFEYKTNTVSDYFNPDWITNFSSYIEDFIYNERKTNGDIFTYNYDTLKSRLITNYDSVVLEFKKAINNP
jgi:hypothetical protein